MRLSFSRLKIYHILFYILFVALFTWLILYEEYQQFQKESIEFKKNFIKEQKELVKKETNRALRYIAYKFANAHNTSIEELKKEIVDAIEHLRDERDGTGYVFIYTFEGVNVADPIQPQNKGKNLLHIKDRDGNEPIKLLIEASKQKDGGFVEYSWKNPLTGKEEKKISYAKAFGPLGWMVGSGFYVDDIDQYLQQRSIAHKDKMIKYMLNISTLSLILLLASAMFSRYISSLIENTLLTIKKRFNEAASQYHYIYPHDLLFEEFKEITNYANSMIKTIKEKTKSLQELNKTLEKKVEEKTKRLSYKNRLLQEHKEKIEKLLTDQNKFLKTAIHEINTPLSIIQTNIDLLKMENIDKKELTNIESGIKIINNIYNDLSYLVKRNHVEYHPTKVDFSTLLQERIEFFNEVAKGNMLEIKSSIKQGVYVYFNPVELQRVIDNNLSNAIKYSYPNTTITIELFEENQDIIFRIATHSPKIENSAAIFKQFYREEHAKGGFGLGLSLVKEICDKYNCTIEVQSTEEKTVFTYIMKVFNENLPA